MAHNTTTILLQAHSHYEIIYHPNQPADSFQIGDKILK